MFVGAHDLNKEPGFRTTYLKEIIYRTGTVTTVLGLVEDRSTTKTDEVEEVTPGEEEREEVIEETTDTGTMTVTMTTEIGTITGPIKGTLTAVRNSQS